MKDRPLRRNERYRYANRTERRDLLMESFRWSDGGHSLDDCAYRYNCTRENIRERLRRLAMVRVRLREVNALEGEYHQRKVLEDERENYSPDMPEKIPLRSYSSLKRSTTTW